MPKITSKTTTDYTWQQLTKRNRSDKTPETITSGNRFIFNTQKRYEELSRLSDEDVQTNETDETTTHTKNKHPRESKHHKYIYHDSVTSSASVVRWLTLHS
jgi:hypothetical protein